MDESPALAQIVRRSAAVEKFSLRLDGFILLDNIHLDHGIYYEGVLGGGGAYSCLACGSCQTIDHASLEEQSFILIRAISDDS